MTPVQIVRFLEQQLQEMDKSRAELKRAIESVRRTIPIGDPKTQRPYEPQAPGVADLALMRGEAPAKADTFPLGHEFVPYDKNRGPCELCHECIPPNGFFCHEPEAAHGRKPE